MWPWEHLVFAYLVCSLALRVVRRRPPGEADAIAIAVASQLPDLIDKPLAWWLSVLPAGRSLGHSLAFGVTVSVVVAVALAQWGRTSWVFGLAYASHLLGDVVYPLVTKGEASVRFLLWPLVSVPTDDVVATAHLAELIADFLGFLATPVGRGYLAVEGAFLLLGLWLWLRDGTPGLGALHWLRRRFGGPRPAERG